MTESYKLESEFQRMRHIPERHLGFGDIHITLVQQEEILATMQKLEHQIWLARGALQEVRCLLQRAESTSDQVEYVMGNLLL